MSTISEQLTELINQKKTLANNLNTKGVEASTSETLNTLVPKVLEISSVNKLLEYVNGSLTTITADDLDGITNIRNWAFYNYTNLTSITIPDSIINIGQYSFQGCTGLNNIIIGDGVTNIDYSAFQNCTNLTNIIIPDNVISINEYAFSGCTNLTSITIGNGVQTLIRAAFQNCYNLTEINFNATNMNDLSAGNVIFQQAGSSSTGIVVNIGANVIKIPRYLFYSYRGSSTTLRPKIIAVNFLGNSQCENIGTGAFYGCDDLTNITIPSSVTNIGSEVFYGCTALTNITVLSTLPPTLANTNAIPNNVTTIYIPAGTLSAYQSATNWSNFTDKFVEMQ